MRFSLDHRLTGRQQGAGLPTTSIANIHFDIARTNNARYRQSQLPPRSQERRRSVPDGRVSVCRASAQSTEVTPHSGYHYDGRSQRFFEGWYFKVTLPGEGKAFATIYSIEDPWEENGRGGVGVQVMGPDDGYILQYSKRTRDFWASPRSLALGACFRPAVPGAAVPQQFLAPDRFSELVEEGYQTSATWNQGSIVRQEGGTTGSLTSTVESTKWAYSVTPVDGWGSRGQQQKSTAGWLATFPVFEPHWQVMQAYGRATGWLEWGGRRYEFQDAPAYAEKNWGAGFPKKWFWIQCNAFQGPGDVSLTAVGAVRGIKGLAGLQEDVGMVGVHWRGEFIELVPWKGEVSWDVDPWGRWSVTARNSEYTAVVDATCSNPGSPLRAPTADAGLAPVCRDSFFGDVRLRLWRTAHNQLGAAVPASAGAGSSFDEASAGQPLLDAVSRPQSGAVEIGGGPWYDTWRVSAKMAAPVQAALNLPFDTSRLPDFLKPPGL